MRSGAVAALLVVAILAGAGVGYLISASTKQASTNQASSCDIAPQGSILHVKITHDITRTPVTNATVDAAAVETCNGVNTTIDILYQPTVNASGVATLDANFDTSYSITVHYGTQGYSFTADMTHSMVTCATISIPSGSLSVTAC